jgi:hypothetical protein
MRYATPTLTQVNAVARRRGMLIPFDGDGRCRFEAVVKPVKDWLPLLTPTRANLSWFSHCLAAAFPWLPKSQPGSGRHWTLFWSAK